MVGEIYKIVADSANREIADVAAQFREQWFAKFKSEHAESGFGEWDRLKSRAAAEIDRQTFRPRCNSERIEQLSLTGCGSNETTVHPRVHRPEELLVMTL